MWKCLAFLLLCCGCILGNDAPVVTSIDVVIRNLPEQATFDVTKVTGSMKTKEGMVFIEEEFDHDLKALNQEYDEVEPNLVIGDKEVSITLYVTLRCVINAIEVQGNARMKTKTILKTLGVKKGDTYSRSTWLEGLNKLKNLYVKKGFYQVSIRDRLDYQASNSRVTLYVCIDEGGGGKISDIRFVGVDQTIAGDLFQAMICRKYHRGLSYLPGVRVRCYSKEAIERDEVVITELLHNLGYADASVRIQIAPSRWKDKLILVVVVNQGALYTVGDITLKGNTFFTKEDLIPCIRIYNQEPYSPQCIGETTKMLRDKYGVCGFVDAMISIEPVLRETSSHVYDVHIRIEEGEQYWVRKIDIQGNTCTKDRVILHESLLCPGDVFSLKKMECTEKRLSNTGYFKTINVYPVSTEEPEYKDLRIDIEEANTGSLGLSLGLNSLNSLSGGIDISEQNFNIAGILSLLHDRSCRSLRGNGEYVHIKVNLGDRSTDYLAQWTKPYFFDTPWIVGVDLQKNYNRYMSKGYSLRTNELDTHATYILNAFLKFRTHYRLRYDSTQVKDKGNALLNQEGHKNGLISMVGAGLYYDSTDHPRRPRNGFRSRFSYDIAGLGGKFDYMKFSYLNTFYYPLFRKGVIKIRGDLQFIKTYDHTSPTDLPLGERLYQGGETSVRGYRSYIIGPKFGNNEPRGGVSSFLISEEYQYTLLRNPAIDAFIFCDAGFVSLKEFDLRGKRYRGRHGEQCGGHAASVGFGTRLEVMKNVPMMLGLGFPIHTGERMKDSHGKKLDLTQRWFFSMGTCF